MMPTKILLLPPPPLFFRPTVEILLVIKLAVMELLSFMKMVTKMVVVPPHDGNEAEDDHGDDGEDAPLSFSLFLSYYLTLLPL